MGDEDTEIWGRITIKTDYEFKPCPFCGSREIYLCGDERNPVVAYYVACKQCGMTTSYIVAYGGRLNRESCRKSAVRNWNRRTYDGTAYPYSNWRTCPRCYSLIKDCCKETCPYCGEDVPVEECYKRREIAGRLREFADNYIGHCRHCGFKMPIVDRIEKIPYDGGPGNADIYHCRRCNLYYFLEDWDGPIIPGLSCKLEPLGSHESPGETCEKEDP